jgi:hypothetical protein
VGSNEEDRIGSKEKMDVIARSVSIYSGESLCGQELKWLLGGLRARTPLLDLIHVAPPISSPATLHS